MLMTFGKVRQWISVGMWIMQLRLVLDFPQCSEAEENTVWMICVVKSAHTYLMSKALSTALQWS